MLRYLIRIAPVNLVPAETCILSFFSALFTPSLNSRSLSEGNMTPLLDWSNVLKSTSTFHLETQKMEERASKELILLYDSG